MIDFRLSIVNHLTRKIFTWTSISSSPRSSPKDNPLGAFSKGVPNADPGSVSGTHFASSSFLRVTVFSIITRALQSSTPLIVILYCDPFIGNRVNFGLS